MRWALAAFHGQVGKSFLLIVLSSFPGLLSADNTVGDMAINEATEHHAFFGLASYYNSVQFFLITPENSVKLEPDGVPRHLGNEWLVVAGRLNTYLMKAEGLVYVVSDVGLVIQNPELLVKEDSVSKSVKKNELSSIAPELDQVRYAHLFSWLAGLSKATEAVLVWIQRHLVESWGLAAILLSVLLKLAMLPIAIVTTRLQRQVSKIQAVLLPKLESIKADYDGEEAHIRLMAAHKESGVTPFYSMKPMIGTLIQIPILIGVFNALGEMPQMDGADFLWIDNLAYPDSIAVFSSSIPMFGNQISLMPALMVVATLGSTVTFENAHAPTSEVKAQKRNLYLMTAAFFILFYPFPAVMVLHWAMTNALQIVQHRFLKI